MILQRINIKDGLTCCNEELGKLSHNCFTFNILLALLHSERPKLHTNLAFLSAIGLIWCKHSCFLNLCFCIAAQRKGKDVEPITIDASTISALVLPDLCYIKNNQSKCSAPTLSIEIKVNIGPDSV